MTLNEHEQLLDDYKKALGRIKSYRRAAVNKKTNEWFATCDFGDVSIAIPSDICSELLAKALADREKEIADMAASLGITDDASA